MIPRTASILSAHGILLSDLVVTREEAVSLICPAGSDAYSEHIKAQDLNDVFERLQGSARAALEAQGVDIAHIHYERYLDVRFRPQIFDLPIDVMKYPFEKADVDDVIEHFIRTYEARFGTGSAFRAAGNRDQRLPHRRSRGAEPLHRDQIGGGERRLFGDHGAQDLRQQRLEGGEGLSGKRHPPRFRLRRPGDRGVRRHHPDSPCGTEGLRR